MMRYILNTLAVTDPDWMLTHSEVEWVNCYRERASDYRLPKKDTQRRQYAELVGADGLTLLTALRDVTTPEVLQHLSAVQTLRLVWLQNYIWTDVETLRWRTDKEQPPAAIIIRSPYDTQAQARNGTQSGWATKRI